ncbi:MAG: protein kinase [Gemmatimonadaceae bacterium]|nr:protein kinase [Gemmatimonadaceae bacterium]
MHDDALPLPSILAERYEIVRRIGRGGMATVYLARDRKHDRDVAVKILHPELAQSLGADRFLREINIAAQLTHPHILPLHDSGETAGLLYFVMPFVVGESLRDRLTREKQLPMDDALRITCQVASALDYAHRHNVLHRDIKPENILLEDGHAVLADFGIARAIGSASEGQLTATGMTLGTPAYMSPEQSAGEQSLDGRSDLYSLASVLHEMLAGEPPFTGPTAQTIIAKRLSGSPPRIRTVRPSIPAAVEEALLRALDPVPADRYATAEQFRAALAACSQESGERYADSTARGTVSGVRGGSRFVRFGSRRAKAFAAIVMLLVLFGAWWRFGDLLRGGGPVQTLAVLPLTNASGDAEFAYLADGLTDALIADLVRIPGVRVISGTSIMRYASASVGGTDMGGMGKAAMTSDMSGGTGKAAMPSETSGGMAAMGPPKTLPEIARELHADLVVQGSLTRTGDSVRVSATLVRAATQQNLWTGKYVRHVRELFLLQQELKTAIVRVVTRGAGGRGVAGRDVKAAAERASDPAAHEAYLKGVYYQAHWKLPQAIEAFERAVAIDPSHAPAQAGLSRAYYFLAFFGDIPPGIAFAKMRRAATTALEQDSLLAEAHGQMALVKMLQEWDWAGAEQEFRRALELSPGHAQIHHDYAHFLLAQGRQRESVDETAKAVALDPANPMLTSCMGWHSLFNHEYKQALAYAAEADAMMPAEWAQVVRGWALLGEGRPDSALLAFAEGTRLSTGAFTAAALANGLAVTGHTAESRRVLGKLLVRAQNEYVSPYDIATVYAGLGDGDETFRWLRRAAEERSTFIVHLGWDSRFDKMRGDPRYRGLVEHELKLGVSVRTVAAAPIASGQTAERRRLQ